MITELILIGLAIIGFCGIPLLAGSVTYYVTKDIWKASTIFLLVFLINNAVGVPGYVFYKVLGPW